LKKQKKIYFFAVFILLSVLTSVMYSISFFPLIKILITIIVLFFSCIALLYILNKKEVEIFSGIISNQETGIKLAEKQVGTQPAEDPILPKTENEKAVRDILTKLNSDISSISDTSCEKPVLDESSIMCHKNCLDILDEIEKNSGEIFKSSKQAFDISDNLAGTAKEAFGLSEKVKSGIQLVVETLSETLKQTNDLYIQSHKITKILDLMGDISAKTHVLSINASVVAAREGSHGKTFEVVAKEIRRLAEETESALREIEKLIKNVVKTISDVVEKTKVINRETGDEKKALISVAGALQGVVLSVEIIRTVSNVSQKKSQEQADNIRRVALMMKSLLKEMEEIRTQKPSLVIPQYISKLKSDLQFLETVLRKP